jgi:hypothetical protein
LNSTFAFAVLLSLEALRVYTGIQPQKHLLTFLKAQVLVVTKVTQLLAMAGLAGAWLHSMRGVQSVKHCLFPVANVVWLVGGAAFFARLPLEAALGGLGHPHVVRRPLMGAQAALESTRTPGEGRGREGDVARPEHKKQHCVSKHSF